MNAENKSQNTETNERTWSQEFEVAGSQLVGRVKELIAEGNVRRLIVRKPSGGKLMEVPLNAGVAVGGFMMLAMPWLLALAAIAGLLTNFKIEVVRSGSGTVKGTQSEATPVSDIPIERDENRIESV